MNVLVIGGAGYIGSHTVKALKDKNHGVIVLDNLSTGYRSLVDPRVDLFMEGDLNNGPLLERLFAENRIDVVMHFAAHSIVGESMAEPLKYYRNNVSATLTLLDVMLRAGVKRFVFSSTAAVYGEPEETPIAEEHPLKPVNPYGRGKKMVEEALADCKAVHGISYFSLRYFNAAGAAPGGNIGERHNPETHLIPNVLAAAAGKKNDFAIFGDDYDTPDGTCIRDYVHVCDLADAHVLAADALVDGHPGGVYNLGSEHGYSVLEVVETARRVTGRNIPVTMAPRRPGDPAILVASAENIRREMGWTPQYQELDRIVQTAWEWVEKAGYSG